MRQFNANVFFPPTKHSGNMMVFLIKCCNFSNEGYATDWLMLVFWSEATHPKYAQKKKMQKQVEIANYSHYNHTSES